MAILKLWAMAAVAGVALIGGSGWPVRGADWGEVQGIKKELLGLAARHAMEQQKREAAAAVAVPFPAGVTAGGGMELVEKSEKTVRVKGTVSPYLWNGGQPEVIRMVLPAALDMVSKHSGLALTVHTEEGTSPEVRIGARLIAADGKKVEILPAVLLTSAWGENPHEVYLDWAFGNFADGPQPAEEVVAILKKVKTIVFTLGGRVRAPERGSSRGPQHAEFELSDLRLVDYLQGSYDPSRNDWAAGKAGAEKDLTLQHRVQEVTGIVANYGGPAGAASAVAALDFCARTQCWDGSFLDGRRGAATVVSGEYTFGFWIYGTIEGYLALRQMKSPALQEKITIGPETMTREAFYQRMYYRAALARAAAIPSKYRDDIIGGDTLMTGANRVLGYAIGMRLVAEVLDDPQLKAEVLSKYQPIMQEIVDAQGRYSGGFPLLGEGDQFRGKGIHYDAGYTRTHMDFLVSGVFRTGDPLLVKMLERYQQVFAALMDSQGTGLLPMISERHQGTEPVALIIPDLTAQVGLKYHLPIIAQWGYNDGIPTWQRYVPGQALNHFTYAARARGYPLGAHMQVLTADTQAQPEPKDLGYLFPRQFPLWSARLMNKEAPEKVVRTSKVYVYPDGHMTNDFKVEVGEFPVTVGVPVTVQSAGGKVTCEAVELEGWPKLWPADAAIELGGDVAVQTKVGEAVKLKLEKVTTITFRGPDVTSPVEAGGGQVPVRGKFILTPEKAGQEVEVTLHNGTVVKAHATGTGG